MTSSDDSTSRQSRKKKPVPLKNRSENISAPTATSAIPGVAKIDEIREDREVQKFPVSAIQSGILQRDFFAQLSMFPADSSKGALVRIPTQQGIYILGEIQSVKNNTVVMKLTSCKTCTVLIKSVSNSIATQFEWEQFLKEKYFSEKGGDKIKAGSLPLNDPDFLKFAKSIQANLIAVSERIKLIIQEGSEDIEGRAKYLNPILEMSRLSNELEIERANNVESNPRILELELQIFELQEIIENQRKKKSNKIPSDFNIPSILPTTQTADSPFITSFPKIEAEQPMMIPLKKFSYLEFVQEIPTQKFESILDKVENTEIGEIRFSRLLNSFLPKGLVDIKQLWEIEDKKLLNETANGEIMSFYEWQRRVAQQQ
jgi:hypothetical protein